MASELDDRGQAAPNGRTNGGTHATPTKPPTARASSPLFSDDEEDNPEPSDSSEAGGSRIITSPPYWLVSQNRTVSNQSVESVLPVGAITLLDNEQEEREAGAGAREAQDVLGRDRNRACWARSVRVVDHVIVNSSATNIGAFVVWNIRVETLNGSYMNIRKRYSEFDEFRQQMIQTFPNFEAAVPVLPPKSVISKFRPRFLEKRRSGLQYFLNCIMLNPEFSGSPVLKDFLFS